MTRTLNIALLLAVGGLSGCLFEPACDTYESCVAPAEESSDAGREPDQGGDGSPPFDANGDANGTTAMRCELESCPDTDRLSVAGEASRPAGCNSFGDLEFFSFFEEASVCARQPREYSAHIRSCDSPYIIDVKVTPTNGCVAQAAVSFELDGFVCGGSDTRCEIDGDTVVRSLLIDRENLYSDELIVRVEAIEGGFDYAIEIASRR